MTESTTGRLAELLTLARDPAALHTALG